MKKIIFPLLIVMVLFASCNGIQNVSDELEANSALDDARYEEITARLNGIDALNVLFDARLSYIEADYTKKTEFDAAMTEAAEERAALDAKYAEEVALLNGRADEITQEMRAKFDYTWRKMCRSHMFMLRLMNRMYWSAIAHADAGDADVMEYINTEVIPGIESNTNRINVGEGLIAGLRFDVDQNAANIVVLQETDAELKATDELLWDHIGYLNNQHNTLKAEFRAHQWVNFWDSIAQWKAIGKLQRDMEAAKRSISCLKKTVCKNKRDIAMLKATDAAHDAEIAALEVANAELEGRVTTLESQMADTNLLMGEYGSRITSAEFDIQTLFGNIAALEDLNAEEHFEIRMWLDDLEMRLVDVELAIEDRMTMEQFEAQSYRMFFGDVAMNIDGTVKPYYLNKTYWVDNFQGFWRPVSSVFYNIGWGISHPAYTPTSGESRSVVYALRDKYATILIVEALGIEIDELELNMETFMNAVNLLIGDGLVTVFADFGSVTGMVAGQLFYTEGGSGATHSTLWVVVENPDGTLSAVSIARPGGTITRNL